MLLTYNKATVGIIVILLSLLSSIVVAFNPIFTAWVLGTAAITVIYLWTRDQVSGSHTLLGLIPGHFLLILAFLLESGISLLLLAAWTGLISATLLFDHLTLRGDRSGSLTSMTVYCIIWGLVFYLLHHLVVVGLHLSGAGYWGITFAFVVLGVGYVILGLYRLRRHDERRSTI